MSYPSSRSIVSGGNGGISRTGERLHSREFLYRVPKSRASREEKERGLCSGERWLVLQKKKKEKKEKKKKAVLGVQTSWRKVTGTGGAERAWNNAHFGVLQIKGEPRRLSAPGRCQGASVGTGGRETKEGASDSGLECPWAPV